MKRETYTGRANPDTCSKLDAHASNAILAMRDLHVSVKPYVVAIGYCVGFNPKKLNIAMLDMIAVPFSRTVDVLITCFHLSCMSKKSR